MPWQVLPKDSEILAVHAAYLGATNEIIYFGGNEHIPEHAAATPPKVDATRLYSVGSGQVTTIPSPSGDVFCCGHALLGDDQIPNEGRLLIGGGTDAFDLVVAGLHHEHFPGIRDCSIYHPRTRTWTTVAPMNSGERLENCQDHRVPTGGRWYPTLLTLPDGTVLAMSGHPGACDRFHDNFIPEVFTNTPAPGGAWHRLGSFTDPAQLNKFQSHNVTYYPRLHVLPTGDIVSASPIGGETFSMTVERSPWNATFRQIASFKDVANADPFGIYNGYAGTSVLLPLIPPRHDPDQPLPATPPDRYTTRILICNAAQPFALDLGKWDPAVSLPPGAFRWKPTSPRALAGWPRRINATAVLLATGEVLVCGGTAGIERTTASGQATISETPDGTGVLLPEIFNPFTNAWTAPNDPATVVRNYHSVAVLMFDGSVWTAGSDHDAARGAKARELRMEIYYPWYHGNPDRPYIDAAPDRVFPREKWPLKTRQAPRIQRVAMVRCSSSTHAFNSDQRYIDLRFERQGSETLLVEFPPNNNIMVPGFYFLYVINDAGLPSYGTTTYARPPRH